MLGHFHFRAFFSVNKNQFRVLIRNPRHFFLSWKISSHVLLSLGNVFSCLHTRKKNVPLHWVIRNYVALCCKTPKKFHFSWWNAQWRFCSCLWGYTDITLNWSYFFMFKNTLVCKYHWMLKDLRKFNCSWRKDMKFHISLPLKSSKFIQIDQDY